MKVLFFGVYNINDTVNNRTRILLNGLKKTGVEVEECVSPTDASWRRFWHLVKKYRKVGKDYDVMFLAHGGAQLVAPLARIITRKKIVADPIVSLYDTMVYDRKKCRRFSLKGFYYYLLDWLMVKLSDIIILDTNKNIYYFSEKFKAEKSKFRRLFIGSDDAPRESRRVKKESNDNKFVVHFHGYFIPLHGIEYIIKAAKILEKENDIIFNIIGRGQTYNTIRGIASGLEVGNINFIEPVPRSEISNFVERADIVLGIFGDTDKASRVIPNKVYDAVAMGKAVVTADTKAIREIFDNRINIMLCAKADPRDLAAKIMELKNNQSLLDKIAEGGYKLFEEKLSPKIIVTEFKKILQEVV